MSDRPARVPGRVDVSRRALERTVVAVAADHLGVKPTEVGVWLSDDKGSLVAAVSAPLRSDSLKASAAAGFRVLATLQALRAQIRELSSELTGAHVGALTMTITRANINESRRVV